MPNRNPTVVYSPTAPRRSLWLLLLRENNNSTTSKPKSTVRLRKSARLNDEVLSLSRSPRFSNHQKASLIEQKADVKMREFPSPDSVRVKRIKMKENDGDEGIAVEEIGVIVEEWKKEQVEGGMEGKIKYGGGGEIVEGWTKEQELALQTACFTAKPSPHFWKHVSKLISDRVHSCSLVALLSLLFGLVEDFWQGPLLLIVACQSPFMSVLLKTSDGDSFLL